MTIASVSWSTTRSQTPPARTIGGSPTTTSRERKIGRQMSMSTFLEHLVIVLSKAGDKAYHYKLMYIRSLDPIVGDTTSLTTQLVELDAIATALSDPDFFDFFKTHHGPCDANAPVLPAPLGALKWRARRPACLAATACRHYRGICFPFVPPYVDSSLFCQENETMQLVFADTLKAEEIRMVTQKRADASASLLDCTA
ncbi:hypothetical protein EDB86DRAFT_3080997 [Lactarius hatsudake]|nr:hypothetical protein EDB86DRAFT_3080997 [Lactarius hatsudake]